MGDEAKINYNQYLGDGLYVDYDGWQVEVYASNGISATNKVFMDPSVLKAFLRYIESRKLAR